MIKNFVKIICFIAIFITLLWFSSRVLRFKNDNGIYQGDSFYDQETNTIDVLFLGSSHIHYNVNPAILYNEYGIASYNYTSGSQPIWSTYHYLIEALKTQKPKLIALESYIVAASRTNVVDYQIVAATYALKWSENRINSLKVTAAERFDEFINPMYRYHNRYKDLKEEDFLPYANNYNHYRYFKGYSFHQKTFPVKKPNIKNIKDTLPLLEQQETYYRKILELAKTNNIPIVVIASPFPMTDDEARHFNRVGEIAKEYDIPFMNFNHYYDDYDLDFWTDYNDAGHLNYKGVQKYTAYLGKYLKDNFEIPDRRIDTNYDTWEKNALYEYNKVYDMALRDIDNINEYMTKITNLNDYTIVINMFGEYGSNDNVVKTIYSNFNITNEVYINNASYVIDKNKLVFSSMGETNYLYHKELNKYNDLVVDSGSKILISRSNLIKNTNSVSIIVYDNITHEVADYFDLPYTNDSISKLIERDY
ncbi:SGNH/GDSL hydrolase family protein [Brachyspira sp.]|uniref:SGNH/GDSL hydrolase family protein n=1 Tax=Brachyspira sp. TaxID=1977261 RepID=UPI0026142483|nr:SGNH/GDSL hydrolase family protein [Brachyspira sp.]